MTFQCVFRVTVQAEMPFRGEMSVGLGRASRREDAGLDSGDKWVLLRRVERKVRGRHESLVAHTVENTGSSLKNLI